MTAKKLTEADKQEILDLYRQTPETTSTLAERYGVSNSTISRLLKATLPEEEYEVLIAAKRAARTPHIEVVPAPAASAAVPETVVTERTEPLLEVESSPKVVKPKLVSRRRRSSIEAQPSAKVPASSDLQLELLQSPMEEIDSSASSFAPEVGSQPEGLEGPATVIASSSPTHSDEDTGAASASAIAEMLGEDLIDEPEDEDIDEDEEDFEDFDDDEDFEEDTPPPVIKRRTVGALVRVLPLSEATLPKTCYLVIDRAAELIAKPLREFSDLGQIPSQEVQEKTLPVFDNHRVARRFSSKRDRVIKIPDSRMLQKARYHLEAKGITRLLVDGQVYSLST